MTRLLETAIEALKQLPAADQDVIADYVLHLAKSVKADAPLTAEDSAAIAEAEAQLANGQGVPAEVAANFWGRHGL